MNAKEFQISTPKLEKNLYLKYGSPESKMIRGGGKLSNPELMLIFMNPTARNVSSSPKWKGLRAPWIGTKQVWQMLVDLQLLKKEAIFHIYNLKPGEWNERDALSLYSHIKDQGLYITNLASCTQCDARPLKNTIFQEYLPVIHREIITVHPKKIITFGNQVSSILLKKNISVSNYSTIESEELEINEEKFNVFPTYYPVGQGRRNILNAIKRVEFVVSQA